MAALAFDTHKAVTALKQAGFPRAAGRGRGQHDGRGSRRPPSPPRATSPNSATELKGDIVATKADIAAVQAKLEADIAAVQAKLEADIAAVKDGYGDPSERTWPGSLPPCTSVVGDGGRDCRPDCHAR